MSFKKLLLSSAIGVLLCVSNALAANDVVYVKAGGTGAGTSWSDAAGNLNTVFAALTDGCNKDVWVAVGEYQATATITVPTTVNMYGGFAGTETELSQRDLSKKSTIKGGDFTLLIVMKAETDVAKATVMDGFIVTGVDNSIDTGNTGAITANKNRNINNCIITGNRCSKNSAAFVDNATISNCLIYNNYTYLYGGAIQLKTGAKMINCTLVNNSGDVSAAAISTGGMRISGDSKVYNSIIWGNTPRTAYVDAVTAEFINCALPENPVFTNAVPVLTNCINLNADNAHAQGPKFTNATTDFTLMTGSPCINIGLNSAVIGDKDLVGNARIQETTVDLGAYEFTKVESNVIYVKVGGTGSGTSWADAAGDLNTVFAALTDGCNKDVWVAVGEYQAAATITIPTTVNVYGGFAGTETELSQRDLSKKSTIKGGAFINLIVMTAEADNSKATVFDGFIVTGVNTADNAGNDGTITALKNRNIDHCIITGNKRIKNGAAYLEYATISNSLIYDNYTYLYNGAVQLKYDSYMVNCTVVNNSGDAGTSSGGMRISPTAKISNSIIWNNAPNTAHLDANTAAFINCALPESPVYSGGVKPALTDCISLNADNAHAQGPKFTNATTDFTLMTGSPCINAGLNDVVIGDKDLVGNDRVQKTTVDLGAYESSLSTGINEQVVRDEVICYPNPVRNFLIVSAENAQRIDIYAVSGAKVLTQEVATNGQVNVSGLASGYYIVRVYTTAGNKQATIIKE